MKETVTAEAEPARTIDVAALERQAAEMRSKAMAEGIRAAARWLRARLGGTPARAGRRQAA
jgi:hypothetical protein